MTTARLEASARYRGDLAIIDLRGDINGLGQEAMEAVYSEAATHEPAVILLNFGAVEFINSTGIALIVGLLGKARASNVKVLTCSLTEHFRKIFEITRLTDFMPNFADEQSAIADLQSGE